MKIDLEFIVTMMMMLPQERRRKPRKMKILTRVISFKIKIDAKLQEDNTIP